MCEYLEYLLDCVDTCYKSLKKEGDNRRNPVNLIQRKQKAVLTCRGGKTRRPITDAKENVSQLSYINLTSMLYPVTGISFEVCSSYVRAVLGSEL